MNFFEVVLVFVVIPLAVVGALFVVTVLPSRRRSRPAYVPGAAWEYSDRFYTGDSPVEVPIHLNDSSLGGARGTW